MSQRIHDLSAERSSPTQRKLLRHPAGVLLPFDCARDAELIVPELRAEIRSGAYCADLLRLLPHALRPRDRVLIIGAGLGVVSTVVARSPGIERVIAVEPDTRLISYLRRVCASNAVPEVETLNAVLADGNRGRVPFFARRDPRESSLIPDDEAWQKVVVVPFMDLSLILTEEQISLVICEIPRRAARMISTSRIDRVERFLVDCGDDFPAWWQEGEFCAEIAARGYLYGIDGPSHPERARRAMLFGKASRPGDDA
jgi:FkbM family methyltransferase